MTISIIIRGNPDKIIKLQDATQEELTTWVNQAETLEDRQRRKVMVHSVRYNFGPAKFFEAYKDLAAGETKIKNSP